MFIVKQSLSTHSGPAQTTFTSQSTSTPSHPVGMSPELEQTLTLLSSHRSILGYMLLSRGHPVSIIRHSGVVFEGEKGKKYASVIGKIVESVQSGLEEISGGENEGVRGSLISLSNLVHRSYCHRRNSQDEVKFLRIRTKRHEIMISPGTHPLAITAPYKLWTDSMCRWTISFGSSS